jgi:hypothetical protein
MPRLYDLVGHSQGTDRPHPRVNNRCPGKPAGQIQYRPWITYRFGCGRQEVGLQAGSAKGDRDRRRTGTCRATGND